MRALPLVFLLGCSSSSSSPPAADTGAESGGADAALDAAPATVPLDAFAKLLADEICGDAEACCTKVIADCRSAVEKKIHDAATKQTYDDKAAAKCLAAYGAAPKCTGRSMASSAAEACGPVLDGSKAPGETCMSVEECKRGGLGFTGTGGFVGCGAPKMGDTSVCIAFRPTGVEGAACNDNIEGIGFERVLCTKGLACVMSKCVRAATLGQACADRPCAEGSCDMGSCKKAPALGEPCPAGMCATDAACMGGTCVKEPLVIPFACIGFACPSDLTCMR